MKSVFLVVLAVIALASAQYLVERETVVSPAGPGRTLTTFIFYPRCVANEYDECGAALAAGQRFPAVIFLQGGSVDQSAYSIFASKLAAEGYIVALPNAARGVAGQITSANNALVAKNVLISRDVTSTSGVFGRLRADSFALAGHSLGGVVALLAGSRNATNLCFTPVFDPILNASRGGAYFFLCPGYRGFGTGLKVIITFGTELFTNGAPVDFGLFAAPQVIIRGAVDSRIDLDTTLFTYDNLLQPSKAYIQLDNANHFGITDSQLDPLEPAQGKDQDWSTSQLVKIFRDSLVAHQDADTAAIDKIYGRKDLGPKFIKVIASQL